MYSVDTLQCRLKGLSYHYSNVNGPNEKYQEMRCLQNMGKNLNDGGGR